MWFIDSAFAYFDAVVLLLPPWRSKTNGQVSIHIDWRYVVYQSTPLQVQVLPKSCSLSSWIRRHSGGFQLTAIRANLLHFNISLVEAIQAAMDGCLFCQWATGVNLQSEYVPHSPHSSRPVANASLSRYISFHAECINLPSAHTIEIQAITS